MASRLAEAQLVAQERLRTFAAQGLAQIWRELGSYDEADVAVWLRAVVPFVTTVERQSVLITNAYVARVLGQQPLSLSAMKIIQSIRGEPTPDEVYRRPFVTIWKALSDGVPYEKAVDAGLARAKAQAAMDVQLVHRATLQAIQDLEPRIRGWKRAANAEACSYCRLLDGAFVKRADAMPMHDFCGCGLEVIHVEPQETPLPDGVAVHTHGEYGPTIADPAHDFTSAADLG